MKGKTSPAEHFGKQQPATYSFIVFRYVFIVQQFADVPAVHFDEVCVQGFVICMSTHYVISFTTSRRLLFHFAISRERVATSNKWSVISWIYCCSFLMIKNYPYHWYPIESAWACRVKEIFLLLKSFKHERSSNKLIFKVIINQPLNGKHFRLQKFRALHSCWKEIQSLHSSRSGLICAVLKEFH